MLRARHRSGAVVAQIGLGWREHRAVLVWQACVGDRNEEPSRPWVVDVLDPTEFFSLNSHEVARLVRWVPALARDLAWAVVPPGTAGDRITPPTRRFRPIEPRWIGQRDRARRGTQAAQNRLVVITDQSSQRRKTP